MAKFIDVNWILCHWLKSNGYDGLSNGEIGCACDLDDLIPCEGAQPSCEAGYKVPCDCSDPESGWEEHDCHIVSKKPNQEELTK